MNGTIHGDLKGVGVFFWLFCASSVTLIQPSILVDHGGHACLTDFGFASIVRGMNSVTQEAEYTAAWAAPEILRGADKVTREGDTFAFGMVVIEVSLHVLLHLVSKVEGWMVRLRSESCLRSLQEAIHSVDSQARSLLQRLWMANGRFVHRGHKN